MYVHAHAYGIYPRDGADQSIPRTPRQSKPKTAGAAATALAMTRRAIELILDQHTIWEARARDPNLPP